MEKLYYLYYKFILFILQIYTIYSISLGGKWGFRLIK